MKLRTKILLVLLPLTVLPLLALGWSAYTQLSTSTKNRSFEQMASLLHQVGLNTEVQLRTARANAGLFASSASVQDFIKMDRRRGVRTPLREEVRKHLLDYQLAYPEYSEIHLIRADGTDAIRSVLAENAEASFEAELPAGIRQLMQADRAIQASVLPNPGSGKPALYVVKPIYMPGHGVNSGRREPDLWGFLVLVMEIGFLEDQVHSAGIGKQGYLFVTSDSGKVLFQPKANPVSMPLEPEVWGRVRRTEGGSPRLEDAFTPEPGFILGKQLYRGLHLFAALPQHELQAESRHLAMVVAAITLFAIVVTVTFLFGVLNTLVVKPIRKLSGVVRDVGHGRVEVPVVVKTDDEIGELATAFQEMGGNLDEYHKQVRFLAYYDNLTGLPNRSMFNEYLHRAIAEARRSLQSLAVLFLDLDNFKRINDTLGHSVGDKLLEEFADRVTACIRSTDVMVRNSPGNASSILARWAGDEFIVMLPRPCGSTEAQQVARRVLEQVSVPFRLGRHECTISTSIGIAVFPDDGVTAEKLVKSADMAMYHAKKLGRNNYQYFSRSLNKQMMERLTLENKLRRALDRQELALYYQPQLDARTQRIIGVEALLRWREMELGAVQPTVFVPIAEETGLIVPITEWLLAEACRQARQWNQAGLGELLMSVNISAVHMNRDDLEQLIERVLVSTGLPAGQLELELTETSILEDPDHASSVLERLKAVGVRLALDDFGTGYSSLSQLRRLPIDKLKIDQSFIQGMETNADGDAIVTAIIAMAHSLHLQVTAEGVENRQQMLLLQHKRCNFLQGFYCAEPMPAQELTLLLQQQSARRA